MRMSMDALHRSELKASVSIFAAARNIPTAAAPRAQALYDIWNGAIGRGSRSVLYHAECATTGAHFALKKLTSETCDAHAAVLHEAALQRLCIDHAHIIAVHAVFPDEGVLVLELADKTLLRELTVEQPLGFSHVATRWRIYSVARALEVMHARGVVHGDLRLEKVMCSRPASRSLCAIVKLSGFGSAFRVTDPSPLRYGSQSASSPGTCDGTEPVDAACDVWALGLMAYTLRTGVHPLYGVPAHCLRDTIMRGDWDIAPWLLDSCTRAFMEQCLAPVAAKRATIAALLASAYFAPLNGGV